MPDKWEYPWYAAWDLAFHCVALAIVDSTFRQRTIIAHDPRVVHASQRPAACLRVGLRRRQSAGPCLGGLACLQSRDETARRRRPQISRTDFSKTAAELHLVGQPQRRRRAATFSKAAFSASTISASSTAASRCPPAANRAIRRHQLDGHVLSQHAGDRAWNSPRTIPPTKMSPASSSSILSTSAMR